MGFLRSLATNRQKLESIQGKNRRAFQTCYAYRVTTVVTMVKPSHFLDHEGLCGANKGYNFNKDFNTRLM